MLNPGSATGAYSPIAKDNLPGFMLLVFNEKSVKVDSGKLCKSVNGQIILTPPKKKKTTCFGEKNFTHRLWAGLTYSRTDLFKCIFHNADQRGANGNKVDGCDSIVVSVQNEKSKQHDDINLLYYSCNIRCGSKALFNSYDEKKSIRVFRSSHLQSENFSFS